MTFLRTVIPLYLFVASAEEGCPSRIAGADRRNTTFLRTEDVGNRFNSWILKTRLAVVEELMGDDKRTVHKD